MMTIKYLFKKRNDKLVARLADWAALAFGVAIFAIVTLWNVTKSSVWFDEAFGAYLIRFDFIEVAKYTANDVHPPLYYWLLKLWSMVFGTTELALRSMSVFFACVAIIFGFLLVRRLFGRKAAWASLLFMVLSPMLIRYGQEARMYTFVTAIALAATYVLTLAMETKKRWHWAMYGVLVALGMWTHYFAAIVWIAHWIWRALVVWQDTTQPKQFLRAFFSKSWISTYILAVGLFLPWLPFLVYQTVNVQVNGFWIPPVSPTTFTNFFTNVLYYQDQETVNPWLSLVFFVVVVATIVLTVRLYRTQATKWRRNYLLLFTLAFIPPLLLFVFSMPPLRSSFVDRYLIPSTLAFALFMGVTFAVARFSRSIQRVGLVVLIAGAMIVGVANVYHLGNYNKTLHNSNNTREMIEAIAARAPAGEPIIADTPWLFYEAVFYSTPQHPVYFIDATTSYKYGSLDMLRYNDAHKIKDLAEFTRQHPVVWYLGRPESADLKIPDTNWMTLQMLEYHDSVDGQPSYKAAQFRTN